MHADIPHGLSLDAPWSIGEEAFRALVKVLRPLGARTIVEFGSGRSSVRLALEFPEVDILSIEHDRGSFEQVLRLRDHYAPNSKLTLESRKLTWQRHGAGLYLSYEPGTMPGEIDAVIIDGPPYWTRRGREACLYQVLPKLRTGAMVFLDDVCRPEEQQIIRNWTATCPGTFESRMIEVGHRISVLETKRPVEMPRAVLSVAIDTSVQALWRECELVRQRAGKVYRWVWKRAF